MRGRLKLIKKLRVQIFLLKYGITLRNMQNTALTAYEYAINHSYVDSEQIVVMGFSLGTASAVYLAANRPVAGLILLTPYANGYDLYNNVLPVFHGPLRLIVRNRLLSERYAPLITSPVLIVASENDEIVPFSSSEKLRDCFPGEPEFIILKNVGHNEIMPNKKTLDGIRTFLISIS